MYIYMYYTYYTAIYLQRPKVIPHEIFFRHRLEARAAVEEVGAEAQVQGLVPTDDVGGLCHVSRECWGVCWCFGGGEGACDVM